MDPWRAQSGGPGRSAGGVAGDRRPATKPALGPAALAGFKHAAALFGSEMMNWLDIVIGGVLTVSLIGALRNGLVLEVTRLAALAVGVIGGLWWCGDLAVHLQPYVDNLRLATFAAFLAIVAGSLLAAAPVAWLLGKLLGWTGMRAVDRLLGAAFGLLRGLAISAAVVLAVIAFHPTAGWTDTVAGSRLAPLVLHGARAAAAVAPPELKLEFSQGFDRVRGIWLESVPKPPLKN